MKPPSDLKVLRSIYKTYYREFEAFKLGAVNNRKSKVYVPIDCKLIAGKLKTDGDIVFGRLYYHMQPKYGYTNSDGSKIAFFSMVVGPDNKCVNFPLLSSVLAGLEEENSKFKWATVLSTLALVVSVAALCLQL